MSWLRSFLSMIVIGLALCGPSVVRACPLCREAIADSNEAEEEKDDFPKAMNQSIMLMLAIPYSALGVVGFMIYRGMKKNDEYRQGLEISPSDDQPAV